MTFFLFFYEVFDNFFFFFHVYKMSKNLSAKYYQENKERLQKKSREKYQSLSKEEKKKADNMVVNVTKISHKLKKKKLVKYRKNYYRIFLLKYKNFLKHVAREFYILKYKKLFKSGFFLLFECRKLLPEM